MLKLLLHHPTHVHNKANAVLPHINHPKPHLISTQAHFRLMSGLVLWKASKYGKISQPLPSIYPLGREAFCYNFY